MAAYFIDLDGTIFYFGTNEFLPNARENLLKLVADGNQLVFTTQRDDVADAKRTLKRAGLAGPILSGVQSPRIVINDAGAHAINHATDAPWGSL